MGLPINVHELIENRVVESSRIEYKADWNPEPIVHTITAFANDVDNMGGGYIVVGIGERRKRRGAYSVGEKKKFEENKRTSSPAYPSRFKAERPVDEGTLRATWIR